MGSYIASFFEDPTTWGLLLMLVAVFCSLLRDAWKDKAKNR